MSKILGIDYGDRRLGLAISDVLGIIARPLGVIDKNKTPDFISEIINISKSNKVELILVGLPITLKGTQSKQTIVVSEFIDKLKIQSGLPVSSIDERLSSIAAERSLQEQGIKTGYNKEMIDQTAAAIILQEYLDSK